MTDRENRARKIFINHPSVDYALGALGAVIYLAARGAFGSHLPEIDVSRRAVLLQTLSGLAVAILGVSVTAVAIIASFAPRERVTDLVKLVSVKLGKIIMGSLVVVGAVALAFAALIAVDGHEQVWPWVICSALVAVLAARTARLLWILSKLFVAASASDRSAPATPTDRSTEPVIDPTKYTLEAAQSPRSS